MPPSTHAFWAANPDRAAPSSSSSTAENTPASPTSNVESAPTMTPRYSESVPSGGKKAGKQLLHADETPWKEAGKPLWLRVFAAAYTTLFFIGSRSLEILSNVLTSAFKVQLITDSYLAYLHLGTIYLARTTPGHENGTLASQYAVEIARLCTLCEQHKSANNVASKPCAIGSSLAASAMASKARLEPVRSHWASMSLANVIEIWRKRRILLGLLGLYRHRDRGRPKRHALPSLPPIPSGT